MVLIPSPDRASVGWASMLMQGSKPRSLHRVGFSCVAMLMLGGAVSSSLAQSNANPADVGPALPEGGAPRLVIEKKVHDFGEMWQASIKHHQWEVRNEGDQPLKILSVKPQCGCTVPKDYDRIIGPKSTGKIPVTLNTKAIHSAFTKHITLTTNDPQAPTVRLSLKGIVKRYVNVTPRSVNFGRVAEDETRTRKVRLVNNTDQPLVIDFASEPVQHAFTAELEEKVPGQDFIVTVTARPPYKEGINGVQFAFRTNIDGADTIKIPAMLSRPPRLELSSNEILIPKARPKSQVREIVFTNNTEYPVRVIEAEVDDPALSCQVVERTPGQRYVVQVTIPAGYFPPETGRLLSITTDDLKSPLFEVPIYRRRGGRTKRYVRGQQPALELVGKPAPAYAFKTVDDRTFDTADFRGAVAVLEFYASWCPFSRRQLPSVEKTWQAYKERRVRFIGVSQDERKGRHGRTKEQVLKHYQNMNLSFPITLDPIQSMGQLFKVKSYPTLFIVGKDGTIESVHIGNKPNLEQLLASELEVLLAGQTRADFPKAPASADKQVSKVSGAAAPSGSGGRAKPSSGAVGGGG